MARPRSTRAEDDDLVVMVSGHFNRAPSAGQSAADVILEGWRAQGAGVLSRVEGEWLVVVYEKATRRLHLARDPFGVRRCFWAAHGDRVAFATTLDSLLALPGISRELARENLAEFLSFRYVHAPRTLLRDVRALPPGSVLMVEPDGAPRVEAWHRLKYAPPNSPQPADEETLSEIERRLFRAVAARASTATRSSSSPSAISASPISATCITA